MKTPLLTLVLALAVGHVAAQDAYVQFQTIYLKPNTQHLATLAANMKAHNDQYHSDAPYRASVWQVSNGPRSGWLVWSMGPSTFAHLDNRPADGGHDEDWAQNVMAHITDLGPIEYWRMNADVSMPPGDPMPHLSIRFYEVNNEMGFLIGDLWEKMGAARKAMTEGRSWALYNNMFQQGELGRHFASVTPFASWGELDNGMDLDPSSPGTFRAAFEKVHGASAWGPFTSAMNAAFKDSFDEIWSLRPDLSAPPLPTPN